jgi:serine/threonine protein kinase
MGIKDLDAGTDIYSFGVMLYEMVVGQVPFSADTPFSIIHDHIYTPLPLPMKVNPKVPEPVQLVLLKALAKDRIDRYDTVEDLMSAFKDAWTQAGVPMQGTAITMRPNALRGDKTDSKNQAKAPINETVVAKQLPVKRRSAWMWVGIGVITIFCCLFGLFAFRNFRANPSVRSTAIPSIVPATEPISTVTPPTPSLPPSVEGSPQPTVDPSIGDSSPEIASARALVEKNPGDPYSHLQLSLAFWDTNQVRQSMEELTQAANLAAVDKDFFKSAAEEYKSREAWVPTAGVYLRLVPLYSDEGLPVDIENDFHEAVYKASEKKDMPLFVFFERIDSVSLPLGYIARGRYALYNGDLADAKVQLANAQKVKPDQYENYLLMAEIEFKTGSQADAKNIFLSLSSDLGAPEWIRLMAENYLSTMK